MSLAFWLRVLRTQPAAPPLARIPSTDALAAQANRLFGTSKAVQMEVVPTRYRLYGVIAGGPQSVALLGIDGQAPRAIGVGKPVAPGVILHKVYFGSVVLLVHGRVLNLSMQPAKVASDPATQREMGLSRTVSPQ
jgi:general secretion pathway protein C